MHSEIRELKMKPIISAIITVLVSHSIAFGSESVGQKVEFWGKPLGVTTHYNATPRAVLINLVIDWNGEIYFARATSEGCGATRQIGVALEAAVQNKEKIWLVGEFAPGDSAVIQ